MTVMAEQRPHPSSRVRLGTARDALGQPRVVLDWRLAPEDRASIVRTLRIMGEMVRAARLGRIDVDDDEAAWATLYGGNHHMGTTRMHADPRRGVVDPDGRVHGLANLFVAGTSVFPTSGCANPTLTAVALTLRLADHLRARLDA
jgi:choline dehydrogenase-like flavoprotein